MTELSNNQQRKAKKLIAIERKSLDKLFEADNNVKEVTDQDLPVVNVKLTKKQIVFSWTFGHTSWLIKLIRIGMVFGGGSITLWELVDILLF